MKGMNTEVMEKKLYSASLKGDVDALEALMREDKLTLSRVSVSSCFNQTPLHLASLFGHFEFVKLLLFYKPDFASRLDSEGRSALHLASAKGYTNIVKLLLEYNKEMCIVPDENERSPLHLAVMNGQYDCVSELMKVNSESNDQRLNTVLHLCVMHNRLDVLVLILESNPMDLSDMKDDEGNTILHYAASLRRFQIVKYLVINRSEEEVNVVNKKGLTAFSIVDGMLKDAKAVEIKELLISAGTKKTEGTRNIFKKLTKRVNKFTIFQKHSEERDNTLLAAASVLVSMAYTSAVSPPGGVAGIDAANSEGPDPWFEGYYLEPGTSLLAYFFPQLTNVFWRANTIAFMAALSVIFLHVTGASLKQKVFIWSVRAAMWLTLSAMIIAYEAAVRATTPKYDQNKKTFVSVRIALYCWYVFMLVATVVVGYRFVRYVARKITRKRARSKQITAACTVPTQTQTQTQLIILSSKN